ncbi:MAG: hypothetical protein ACOCG5_11000 [Candidatus Alkaliphilus sp. MAG34]
MLYTAFKAASAAAAFFGLLVCFVRMGMDGFVAGIDFLWRYLLIAAAVVFLLMGFSYLILCLTYKGTYTMQFEMDEAGILHTEAPGQRKKSRRLGVAAAVVGTATGYSGVMGLATVGQVFYSRFAQVRVVKAVKKQNLIRLSSRFVQNRIYASPEQFDFVWQYITFRCPKGKTYE